MEWTWDPKKNRANRREHGFGFETALLVFDDALALTERDPHANEERWRTIGTAAHIMIFVAHTWPEEDAKTGEEKGRNISARKATRRERKIYEEGKF